MTAGAGWDLWLCLPRDEFCGDFVCLWGEELGTSAQDGQPQSSCNADPGTEWQSRLPEERKPWLWADMASGPLSLAAG